MRVSSLLFRLSSFAICSGYTAAVLAQGAPTPHAEYAPGEPVRYVNVTADNPETELWVQSPGQSDSWGRQIAPEEWTVLCKVPCHVAIDPSLRYRIDGRGILQSNTFRIGDDTHHLSVDTGSKAGKIGGWVLFGLGAQAALSGGLFLLMADMTDPTTTPTSQVRKRIFTTSGSFSWVLVPLQRSPDCSLLVGLRQTCLRGMESSPWPCRQGCR